MEKLKLAICDDDIHFLQDMEKRLKEDKRVGKVSGYSRPELLLKDIEEKQMEYDAVFMDIEFDEKEQGIQSVRKIYEMAPNIQMVYVTGFSDRYIQQVFLSEANLTGYLIKPVDQKLLEQYLEKLYKYRQQMKILKFSVRGKEYFVNVERILYLESDNHRTRIYTDDQIYSVYDKLGNFISKLPPFFIQCHKSFIVNMNRIRYMEGNEIYLQNESRIPISKIHQEKVRKIYFAHIGNAL